MLVSRKEHLKIWDPRLIPVNERAPLFTIRQQSADTAPGRYVLAGNVGSRANPSASRRLVFTRSPAFFGMSDGATTRQVWPRLSINL